MLTTDLFSRSLGALNTPDFDRGCATRLLHALQPAPTITYHGNHPAQPSASQTGPVAHPGGVNALAIDRFEGRYMVSGAVDGRISMWDLESGAATGDGVARAPVASVDKAGGGHAFGVTGLSFYPFDSMAFLSSSYDHTLKVFDSVSLSATASFALQSVIYSHSISTIASHLLVACATQHPAISLADLKTGTATHSLVGHTGGAVLAVAWSPKHEHILASGGSDGTVRLWDIRRSAGALGVLDMDDAIGIAGHDGYGTIARRRERGRAHLGPVNSLTWTEDGRHLVSAGHDERVRVWDMLTGANTLANFGPSIRNSNLASLPIVLSPQSFVKPTEDFLFYPNEREIVMFELFEGRLFKRLRPLGMSLTGAGQGGRRNARGNVVSLAWRHHSVELVSGHSDGVVRTWLPRTSADALAEESDNADSGHSDDEQITGKKRKLDPLDEM